MVEASSDKHEPILSIHNYIWSADSGERRRRGSVTRGERGREVSANVNIFQTVFMECPRQKSR